MYTRFFGLDHVPFSIAPDPRYLYMSERHREALAHLLYGLNGGGGFVLLTGEIGAGKTTVCRLFLEQIPANCTVAYIFNPKQTVTELLQSICDEFGVTVNLHAASGATVKDFIDPLNRFLLASHAEQRNNILIIDEAQNLSADVLEQLRLLTNLETSERKLLQIILIGQPELRTMLARPELEQLAQRVIARFHLGPLSADETADYIRHRLAVARTHPVGAGGPGGAAAPAAGTAPFGDAVLRHIHRRARGIPRRINLLCDRALLGAYARGQATVDNRVVDVAAGEVFGTAQASDAMRWSGWPTSFKVVAAMGVAVGVAVLGLVVAGGVRGFSGERGIAAAGAAAVAQVVQVAQAGQAGQAGTVAQTTPRVGVNPLTGNVSPASVSAAVMPPAAGAAAVPASGAVGSATLANAVAANGNMVGPKPALTAQARSLDDAYQRLGRLWRLDAGGANFCPALQKQAVYCFNTRNGLADIRALGRPGILTLYDGDNEKYYALLIALDANAATVRIGELTEIVSLNALAQRWRGAFTTLWRGPPDLTPPIRLGERGAAVDWLATRLAKIGGRAAPLAGQTFDATLQAQVREFQLVQGLAPDGAAGPQTLIRLATDNADGEPRLQRPLAIGVAAAPSGIGKPSRN